MGRASRRKRNRSAGAPPAAGGQPTGARGARPRRRLPLILAGIVAVALAVAFGSRLLEREPPRSDATGPPDVAVPPKPSFVVPDPDTSAMTPPVARAIREARQAALARPGSAAAVGRLGDVLHAHWLYAEAAACYEEAHRLAPGEFRWLYLLAGVEDIRGADGERIDRLFREAVRLAPGFPPLHVRRADALLRLGRWSEALAAYRRAIELDPTLVLAHRGAGQAATLLGEGATAVEHLERAAALAPEDRIVHVALARAYALVGRSGEAAEASRKAEELTFEAGLPDQIFFEIQNMAVDPESLRGRLGRRLRAGAFEALLDDLALLEESEGPGARRQLAAAFKRRANQLAYSGDFDAALPEFERASRIDPTDPEIEHNWGTVHLRRDELEPAARHFTRAIELDPQSVDSLYNLGVVLEKLGRTDEAIDRFQAAAAINPNHVAAGRLAELGVPVGR